MRILNLYAGVGGNRKLWDADITAIKMNTEIAQVYAELYPNDKLVIGDAHHFEKNIYYGTNNCPAQILRNCVHPLIGKHMINCANP